MLLLSLLIIIIIFTLPYAFSTAAFKKRGWFLFLIIALQYLSHPSVCSSSVYFVAVLFSYSTIKKASIG